MSVFTNKLIKSLFCVEPFPELPLSVTLFRLYVKQVWLYLGCAGQKGQPLRIAVFGAGRHTAWLFQITGDIEKQPVIIAVLDDSYQEKEFHGYPVLKATDFDPASADLVLISTDTVSNRIEEKCIELYSDKIRILNMYKDLPPGPYYKEFEQFNNSSYVS